MELRNDFTTSVRRAFDEIDPNWESYNGLVVCGTHAPSNTEAIIQEIHDARVSKLPTLGICAGLQLMAIEYARSVLGIRDATSEEFGEQGEFVVYKLPALNVGLIDGENYWNRYAVRKDVLEKMATDVFSPRYIGVQYHPEYGSLKDAQHPLLVNFIKECQK